MASEAQAHPEPGHDAHGHDASGHDAHEHGHFGPEMWVIPERSGLVSGVVERQQASSGLLRWVFIVGGLLVSWMMIRSAQR